MWGKLGGGGKGEGCGECVKERVGEIIVGVKMEVRGERRERGGGGLVEGDIECW